MRLKVFALLLVLSTPIYGRILLDETMSSEEMRRTGIDDLSYSQKMALEKWLNENFQFREDRPKKRKEQLYLSLNVDDGARLQLSDGSTYEIDPEDRIYTAYWITPFPIMVSESEDPKYPVKITNLNTGTSVNGKQISTKQILEEKREEVQKVPEKMKPPPKEKMKQ